MDPDFFKHITPSPWILNPGVLVSNFSLDKHVIYSKRRERNFFPKNRIPRSENLFDDCVTTAFLNSD